MLSQFPAHIANARRAVETNYEFVKKIVSSAVGMFENSAVSHFVSLWKNVRVYYSVQHVNKGESQNTNQQNTNSQAGRVPSTAAMLSR